MGAPVLLVCALLIPRASRVLLAAAVLLFAIGSAGLWVATSSGGAAYELVEKQGALEVPEIKETLDEHSHLGNEAKNYFTIFTAVLALYALLLGTGKLRLAAGANAFVLLLFLGASGWLALLLANAAHEGGELVHVHGITAPLEGGAVEATEAAGDSDAEDNSGSGGAEEGGSDNSGPGSANSGRDSG
jgi:hypothetical protein